MTPTKSDPPAPPLATPAAMIGYASEPAPGERRYGRADRGVFAFCAAVGGADLALGAFAFTARSERVYAGFLAVGGLFFAACVAVFLVGQFLFWRRRPDGDLPPASAFALVCVAVLGVAIFVGNFLFVALMLK